MKITLANGTVIETPDNGATLNVKTSTSVQIPTIESGDTCSACGLLIFEEPSGLVACLKCRYVFRLPLFKQ